MATYWENSCSFGLRYVSWYKYLIVSLVFSHLGFWSGNLFLIAPFPDLCLLVHFHDPSTPPCVLSLDFNIVSSIGEYSEIPWHSVQVSQTCMGVAYKTALYDPSALRDIFTAFFKCNISYSSAH